MGDALKILKEANDVRVVILVPDYKTDFFRREIGAANVIIEGVKTRQPSQLNVVFRYLGSSLVDTPTIYVNKRVQLDRDGRHVRFFVSWILMKLFSRILIFKKLVRYLDYISIKKNSYANYFLEYKPQLVFVTDVFNDNDVYLLAESKSKGVKTVGMIRSWDNFTTKGFFRMKPDYLLVHNEILKREAVKYCDVKESTVVPVGIPQYDCYLNGSRVGREMFFKKLGFDPSQKLILFSPFGQRFTDTDWQVIEILKRFIENGEVSDAQVLVRCTPNDPVFLGNFVSGKYFYIDCPGRGFKGKGVRDQELTKEDMEWLADCLYHSNLVVAGGASIGIDGACFGKPTILIHFDGLEKKPYWQSVKRFLEYQHPRVIIESGAMRSAKDIDGFKRQIISYLKDPTLDGPAREKMLLDQCWKLDGCSGCRIGAFLNSLLFENNG